MACEELHWSLIALLLPGLMGVDALVSGKCDPLRLSVGSGSEELNGTFDMMGNFWEWYESPYDSGYFAPDTEPATLLLLGLGAFVLRSRRAL